MLATVAAVVQSNVRDSDFLGRYGGEEFVVLLPDTARPGGVMLAEKLRQSVEDLEIPDRSSESRDEAAESRRLDDDLVAGR